MKRFSSIFATRDDQGKGEKSKAAMGSFKTTFQNSHFRFPPPGGTGGQLGGGHDNNLFFLAKHSVLGNYA